MSIQRPHDDTAPSPQSVDPFTAKIGQFQAVNPELDNGAPYKSGNLPEMQFISRTTGPGQTNTAEMILARSALMDGRLSQNRGF